MTRFEIATGMKMVCQFCGATEGVELRPRNTQYNDDDLNWVIACDECIEIDNEYYKERWAEYNSSRI
jgi:hypothetical protein